MLGDWAVQNGWLARALRILTEAGEDTPEHGWVLIIKSYTEPDAAAREELYQEAIAVGRRFADPNIEIESVASLGRCYRCMSSHGTGNAGAAAARAASNCWPPMPGNQEAMDGFARVNAGVTSPSEFFSPQNVERIMSQAGAVTAVH